MPYPPVNNGRLFYNHLKGKLKLYAAGTTVFLHCNAQHYLRGELRSTCLKSGRWWPLLGKIKYAFFHYTD